MEDYLDIHIFMDTSKATIADNRHRALTHTSWFIGTVLERVFGYSITNSDGKIVSVRDIGEQHVMEDLGFIPTPQDYLAGIPYEKWMNGFAAKPPSMKGIETNKKERVTRWDTD